VDANRYRRPGTTHNDPPRIGRAEDVGGGIDRLLTSATPCKCRERTIQLIARHRRPRPDPVQAPSRRWAIDRE
jgi:hypothetical protein